MSKSNIIDQILLLMKENGITNREILQNNINISDKDDNLVTIGLLTKHDYEKYKNFIKLDKSFTLSGNRYFYLGAINQIYFKGIGYRSPDTAITGVANTTNYNKYGYDVNYTDFTLGGNAQGVKLKNATYFVYDNLIIQNNNNISFSFMFSTNYTFYSAFNQYNKQTSNINISSNSAISKQSVKSSYSVIGFDSGSSNGVHTIYVQHNLHFLPCFKI